MLKWLESFAADRRLLGTVGGSRRLSVAKSFAVNSFDDEVDASLAEDGGMSSSGLSKRLDSLPTAGDDGRETVRDVAKAAASSLREPNLDSNTSSSSRADLESGVDGVLSVHSESRLESAEVKQEAESDEGWMGWARGLLPWGRKAEQAQDEATEPVQVPSHSF